MNRLFLALLSCIVFLSVCATTEAQDAIPEAIPENGGAIMVAYSSKHYNPLKIGDPVWVNLGDSPCAYPRDSYRPKATAECFNSYFKAQVSDIFKMYKYQYVYRIVVPANEITGDIFRNAHFDELLEVLGLSEKWSDYSSHFLLLNW